MPRTKPTPASFKKGQSGNPKGAPLKEEQISHWIRKALADASTSKEYGEAMTQAQAMATDYVKQYWKAQTIQEKSLVFEKVSDRSEGKPKQLTELTGKDGKDLFSMEAKTDEELKAILEEM